MSSGDILHPEYWSEDLQSLSQSVLAKNGERLIVAFERKVLRKTYDIFIIDEENIIENYMIYGDSDIITNIQVSRLHWADVRRDEETVMKSQGEKENRTYLDSKGDE